MISFRVWLESKKQYMPIGKKSLSTFVRFGGLSPVKQRGFKDHNNSEATFHTPPARKGIYAFPALWVERFLVPGNRSKESPRYFNYQGDIWHHLSNDVQPGDIKAEKGGWVKTSFEVWSKAFKRTLHNDSTSRKYNLQRWRAGGKLEDDPMDIIPYSGDHIEVFIERV